jgi:HSP20 family molecular chaperone IbpA
VYQYTQSFSPGIYGFFPNTQVADPLFRQGNILGGIQPRVDIVETQSEIICIFEVPGAEPDTIKLEIEGGTLHLEGPVDMGLMETVQMKYVYRERPDKYSRILVLPREIDSERAVADAKNGLVLVRFPKKKTGKRLEVNQQQQQLQPRQQQLQSQQQPQQYQPQQFQQQQQQQQQNQQQQQQQYYQQPQQQQQSQQLPQQNFGTPLADSPLGIE